MIKFVTTVKRPCHEGTSKTMKHFVLLYHMCERSCLLISSQATTRCSSSLLEPRASASERRWPHATTLVSLFDFEDQRNKWVKNSVIPNKCLSAAIKNLRGEYYLNGHWVIEFSRATPIAGTMLYYQRGAEGDNVPETIIGRGPTTEPLVVEVKSHRYKFIFVFFNLI